MEAPSVRITVEMPESLADELKVMARREMVSMSDIVRRAVKREVERAE